MALRHGIFLAPFHSLAENPTLCFERDLELVEMLDGMGFAEAWIGEHHSAGLETIDSPEIFIAAAAERTKHLRFGTGVVSLPYHHPLNVANRIIQLDHMTRGRIMFGGGPGLLASDALMMGIEPEATRDRMAEALDVILRLFTARRSRRRPSGTRCATRACTSCRTRSRIPRSRRQRGHAVGWPSRRQVRPRHAVRGGGRIGRASTRSTRTGRSPTRSPPSTAAPWIGVACGSCSTCTWPTRASRPKRTSASVRRSSSNYFNNNMPRLHVPEGVDPVDWVIEHKVAVVGTVDDAIERIEQVYDKQGEFGCLLIQANNWAPWAATKRSYELYARYVMPHFSGVNANRYASYEWVTEHQGELVEKRVAAAQQMFDKHAAEQSAKAGGAIDRPGEGKETW